MPIERRTDRWVRWRDGVDACGSHVWGTLYLSAPQNEHVTAVKLLKLCHVLSMIMKSSFTRGVYFAGLLIQNKNHLRRAG